VTIQPQVDELIVNIHFTEGSYVQKNNPNKFLNKPNIDV